MTDPSDIFFIFMACLLGIMLIIFAPRSLYVDAKCKELGWKNSSITWNLKAYCIREENEYEITKPLSELLK